MCLAGFPNPGTEDTNVSWRKWKGCSSCFLLLSVSSRFHSAWLTSSQTKTYNLCDPVSMAMHAGCRCSRQKEVTRTTARLYSDLQTHSSSVILLLSKCLKLLRNNKLLVSTRKHLSRIPVRKRSPESGGRWIWEKTDSSLLGTAGSVDVTLAPWLTETFL